MEHPKTTAAMQKLMNAFVELRAAEKEEGLDHPTPVEHVVLKQVGPGDGVSLFLSRQGEDYTRFTRS
jgi:hypothetical protein